MSDFWTPFGGAFWLTIAGFAGCAALMLASVRAGKLTAARLLLLGLLVLSLLQSTRFYLDIKRGVASSLASLGRLEASLSLWRLENVTTEAAMLWSSGVLTGLALMRLLQLWRPAAAAGTLQELADSAPERAITEGGAGERR